VNPAVAIITISSDPAFVQASMIGHSNFHFDILARLTMEELNPNGLHVLAIPLPSSNFLNLFFRSLKL